jgi:hypothetical protein
MKKVRNHHHSSVYMYLTSLSLYIYTYIHIPLPYVNIPQSIQHALETILGLVCDENFPPPFKNEDSKRGKAQVAREPRREEKRAKVGKH